LKNTLLKVFVGGLMISIKQMINDGFVEIRISQNLKPIYGAKISYSLDGNVWNPCSIFSYIDADKMLRCSFWEWNEAVRYGNVKFNGSGHPVYWNLYLNNLHKYTGDIKICIKVLTDEGITEYKTDVELLPCKTLYISDWNQYVLEKGWKIESGYLMFNGDEEVKALTIKPGISGRYKIYFGILYGIIHMRVSVSNEKIRYPFIAERNRPEFQDKYHKEILWKSVELDKNSAIEISPTPLSIRENEKWPFGSIHYIKIVPDEKKKENTGHVNSKWSDKTLALYFEPYSWAFLYNLEKKYEVKEAMKLFREMGANEIHTQVIRFGSKALHYSRIAERHSKGAMMGDDGTFSPGPASMVRSLDILRETIDACSELGMVHYANAGLTNCYPGTDLEEKISRHHPEWRTGNILRYNVQETRQYAASIIGEFIEWGTHGVSIDCMRYPYYHTEEDLISLFMEIHNVINKMSGKRKIPLTVRIPAGDIVYYKVFETLAKQGIIQCVIPSNLLSRSPIFSLRPYIKLKDYGCRVFGIMDGWLTHLGSFSNSQISLYRYPSDIKYDIRRFFNEGADGIFVYQADGYCADPFTRTALDWKNWK
jgi:hypothetical protein